MDGVKASESLQLLHACCISVQPCAQRTFRPKKVVPTVGLGKDEKSAEKARSSILKHFRHLVDETASKAAFLQRMHSASGLSRRSSAGASGSAAGSAGGSESCDGEVARMPSISSGEGVGEVGHPAASKEATDAPATSPGCERNERQCSAQQRKQQYEQGQGQEQKQEQEQQDEERRSSHGRAGPSNSSGQCSAYRAAEEQVAAVLGSEVSPQVSFEHWAVLRL